MKQRDKWPRGQGGAATRRSWPRAWKRGLILVLAAILGLLCLGLTQVAARGDVALPLSTRAAQIVDRNGQTVMLRGVNWFGAETDRHVPHGLWVRDYADMLAQIKASGYNFIRLPFSLQGLEAKTIQGVDFRIGANRQLEGKTPQEVMDAVIQAAQQQGLMVLLDNHRLNDREIPPLWYDSQYSEQAWIEMWVRLAKRYRNQPNVIGADLKNEPHGPATWGSNDPKTDWRLAAQKAGNAILKVNPDWLIVVEGVEQGAVGQKLKTHWQGGNLEGVRQFPVRLDRPNKLVYSPHEYGPGVFNHPWFSDKTFPKNLRDRWETGFHYIARRRIAPVLIGEFGGRKVDSVSPEGVWQRSLVEFIRAQQLSYAYWSWNPNSQDTGGLLLEDWKTLDAAKHQMLLPVRQARGLAPVS